MSAVVEAARAAGGYVRSSSAVGLGVSRREFSEAVARGELERVGRGLYCTPETWVDEYVAAQHRFARGVFSHDTALYLLSLSDSAPEVLTMTFPRGYNPSSVKAAGLLTKSSPQGLHDLGTTVIATPYGNQVRSYDAERTLCDMLRGTASPDLQLVSPAFRSYLRSSGRSLPKLQEYARALGVERKVKNYMEVLL